MNEKHDDRAASPNGEFEKLSKTPFENSTPKLSAESTYLLEMSNNAVFQTLSIC
jgi:hypothetical protein